MTTRQPNGASKRPIASKVAKAPSTLRRQALNLTEAIAAQSPESLESLSPEQTWAMHELRVHQTQLVMQNEELRRSQLELAATQARYFDLYDLAPVGYCTVSEKGLIVQANLTAATLLGLTRQALLDQPVTHFVLTADQDVYYHYTKKIRETGEAPPCKVRLVKSSGTSFWAHLVASRAQDDQGASVLRVVLTDVTELRSAHDQIRKLSLAVEQSAESILITDIEGRIEYVNETLTRSTGYPREELVGKNPRMLQSGLTPAATYDALWDALKQGLPWKGQLINRRKDGSQYVELASITPLRQPDGRITHYVGVKEDITATKRMGEELDQQRHHLEQLLELRTKKKQELLESEMRWQFAVESRGDAMWDWDAENDELYLTAAAKELFELPDTGSKWRIADLIAKIRDEDRAEVQVQINDMMAGKTSEWWAEWRPVSAEGTLRWVGTRGRVMTRAPNGQPRRIVSISHEATQRKLREAEYGRQGALLAHQGRLVLLGELASALAHEMNQPLTAIAGFAGAAARKVADQPLALELVRAIEEQAMRAGEIAWRMRNFARRQRLGPVALSLHEVVVGVAKWMHADQVYNDVFIDITGVGVNLPKVEGDRVELEQVLFNLVRNGIEAGLPEVREQRIAIAAVPAAQAGAIEITVTDWGSGLPADANFDAFASFTSSKAQGLGLGLTICASIIEGHGGHLWATPNPQGGTVFHFNLQASTLPIKIPVGE